MMVITIAREITYTPKVWKNDKATTPFTVTFKVPTAEDMERVMQEKPSDTKLFQEFVVKTEHLEIDATGTSHTAATLVSAPGTYALISEVAGEIMRYGVLGEAEKKV